jgi:hypothetical protein
MTVTGNGFVRGRIVKAELQGSRGDAHGAPDITEVFAQVT